MWLYYLCNRNKWYETQIFHGGSKFHSVQWSLNSWPFAGKSGTGQCTHCRGGAESVLTLSSTVIGVGLHRLGLKSNLGQVEVQLGFASLNFNLASMDLASMYLCCSSCNFSSRPPRPSPSSTRLRLVELGLGLSGLEWSQRWSTSCNFSQVHLGQVEVQLGFASLDFNLASMDLIGVCGGSPRATPMKSNFGQVEVQLGFASLDFNLTEIGLQPK